MPTYLLTYFFLFSSFLRYFLSFFLPSFLPSFLGFCSLLLFFPSLLTSLPYFHFIPTFSFRPHFFILFLNLLVSNQTLSRASNGAAEVTKVKDSGQANLLGVVVGDRLIGTYVHSSNRVVLDKSFLFCLVLKAVDFTSLLQCAHLYCQFLLYSTLLYSTLLYLTLSYSILFCTICFQYHRRHLIFSLSLHLSLLSLSIFIPLFLSLSLSLSLINNRN